MKFAWLIVLLICCGCGRRPDGVVRAAVYPILDAFPFYLAQELGHFREEGPQVSIEEFSGGTKIMESLVAGSSDVSGDGLLYAVVMAAQGRQLRNFFNTYDATHGLVVVPAANAARIRSVADLKGIIVGIGSFGGLHHRMLAYYLRRVGLSEKDVQLTVIGVAGTSVAAIQHGKVDAAVINGSSFALLKRQAPGVRILVDPRSPEQSKELFGVAAFPAGQGLMATAQWLSQNPDKARRMVRAMARTLRWIHEHSPEEVLDRVPASLRSQDRPLDLEHLRLVIPLLSKDGRMPTGGPEAVQRVVAASLESAKSIDLAGTWTNEFFEVAK